jgi:uncharacterized damage-inducible protein DinB
MSSDLQQLQRLFSYDDWANREAAASVARPGDKAPEKARNILAHIIGTQWLWYARITQTESKMAVWPKLSPAECADESPRLHAAWEKLLRSAAEQGLDREVHYKNSKGEPWTSTLGEILTHVAMHGSYHRGQIATLLRDSGAEPAYTDYIHAVRNRFA